MVWKSDLNKHTYFAIFLKYFLVLIFIDKIYVEQHTASALCKTRLQFTRVKQ